MKAWLLSLVAAIALIAAPGAGAASGVNPNGMRGATQVIEIAANGMRTTHATARTHRFDGERRRLVHRAPLTPR